MTGVTVNGSAATFTDVNGKITITSPTLVGGEAIVVAETQTPPSVPAPTPDIVRSTASVTLGRTSGGTSGPSLTETTADVMSAVPAFTARAGLLRNGVSMYAVIAGSPLAINGTASATGTVGATYSFTPVIAGGTGPYTFALTGTAPAGTSFSTSTGAISGTLTTAATYSGLSIRVTDSLGAVATLSLPSIVVSAAGSSLNTLGPSTAAFAAGAMPGLVFVPLTGKTPGSTITFSPSDGRVVVNADGNLVVGTSASTAGATISGTITETLGGVTNTSPISITVASAVAPPSTNLVGWYKADVGVTTGTTQTAPQGTASYGTPSGYAVTGWADNSGLGNNLTGADSTASPTLVTLDGNPRVRFQSPTKSLSLPSGMALNNTALSVFAIVRSAANFDGTSTPYGAAAAVGSVFAMGTAGGVGGLSYTSSHLGNRDSVLQTPTLLYAGQSEELIGVQYGPTGNTTKVSLVSGRETALVNKGTSGSTTGGYVGSYTANANGFTGDILELLIYADSNVSAAAISAYAQARYHVGPTSQTVPVLFGDGDSQMAGQNVASNLNDAADNMLVKLARMIGASGVQPKMVNFGVGGQTIAQRRAAATTAKALDAQGVGTSPYYPTASGYGTPILIVDMGTNSIANGIQTPANGGTQDGPTTVSDLDGYIADRITAGWNPAHIYVVPIRPRSGSGGYAAYDTARAYYNGASGAPTVCTNRGAKWLGQFLNHPAWSGTVSTSTTYYQSDSVHQNQRTMSDEASIILAQLKSDGFVP